MTSSANASRASAGRLGILLLLGLVVGLDRLHLAGRVVLRLEALQDLERLLAGDHHVHPPVLEPLQHLGDPRHAADPVSVSPPVPDTIPNGSAFSRQWPIIRL